MKKLTALALALVIALSVIVVANPSDTQAASTKEVTAATNCKKAPAIKTGTTKVTYKQSKGYVKFTAPKKGTYVITFSGLATKPVPASGRDICYSYCNIGKKILGSYLDPIKVKTNKNKKTDVLWVTTKYCWNDSNKAEGYGVDNYLYSRTATLSLKKGETIYIYNYASTDKHTLNINIKKKK
jgi:hypothetical protein